MGIRVATIALLLMLAGALPATADRESAAPPARSKGSPHPVGQHRAAQHRHDTRGGGGAVIDVNRPTSPFDCDLPLGIDWYGSRGNCLVYLCAGQNVYNEYIFDAANRRRRNPCYGQSPTDFPQ